MVITVSSLSVSMRALPAPPASTVNSRTIVSASSHLSSSTIVTPGKIVPFIPSEIIKEVGLAIVDKSEPLLAVLVFLNEISPVTVLSVRVVPPGSNFTLIVVAFPTSSSSV